jgi:8-oxo-dGTP diphosphatase
MLKVTCAIIVKLGKILVVQNGSDSDHPFQWEFPGGKIKGNETAEECIKREIREELEIEINILKTMCAVQWDYGFKKIELIPFLCKIDGGDIFLTEHDQFIWSDWKYVLKMNLSEADQEIIKLKANQQILEEYFRENMHNT